MKKFIVVLVLMLSLVACSKNDKPVLKVYNWGEYIDRSVIRDFEKEFDVRVQYDVFSSNELMYTKLSSEDYDVLVPSDYMIQRLIAEDKLQKLDYTKLDNFIGIDEVYLNAHHDPDQEYSVPYFVGSVGLVYNKDNIDPSYIETLGWDVLMDETYKDNNFFYNSERDAFMVALKALGYSMNTDNEKELNEAYDWLVTMKKKMNPVYVDDTVIDAMAAGEKDLAVMYSGDAAYVMSENESLAYLEPHQGTNIWIDAMVITKTSEATDLAHEFINFVLREDNAEKISLEVGYTSPITKVAQKLSTDEGEFAGINAYNPRAGYDKDEAFYFNEKIKPIMNELWSKVTAIK